MEPKTSPLSASSARPYVLAWRLEGRKVLVVGAGAIGTGKIETLLGTGARVMAVDPTPSPRVVDLAQRGKLVLKQRRFRPSDVVGAALVIAATGESHMNRRIRWAAKLTSAVVNAVDDPPNCDVTVPAVIHRGPATVAISSGGATPAGARFLREKLTHTIDAAVPEGIASLFVEAHDARQQLRSDGDYRYDYHAWKTHLFEPGLDAIARGSYQFGELRDRFLSSFRGRAPAPAGRVTLVGAGPGGPDLITLRGASALAAADVVVYDRLADPALLALAPAAAEKVPMGKAKGAGVTQHEINVLLVERARAGDHVVRLKGGDPFVFGRGGEEAAFVAAAGIEVNVVPGVSSALAAPALAGVPVTDRDSASSFTVVSGHRADGDCFRIAAAASPDATLVVLMASSTAHDVADVLLAQGWSGQQTACFIHAAGTEDQQQQLVPLRAVAQSGCPFPAPTVMVIGPTVSGQAVPTGEELPECSCSAHSRT